MRALFAAALLCLAPLAVDARDNGQYAQTDPALRGWYGNQVVPDGSSKGTSCCSSADGVQAEDDYRGEHYWAHFIITISVTGEEIEIPWTEVPPEAVLQGPFPSRLGQPIVWWWAEWDDSRIGKIKRGPDGQLLIHIRCFKPGSGV